MYILLHLSNKKLVIFYCDHVMYIVVLFILMVWRFCDGIIYINGFSL